MDDSTQNIPALYDAFADYHHVVSHQGIVFGGFAAAMLLTAWLTTNVLKGIDDAVFSESTPA